VIRCMDCPLDATHTLVWQSRRRAWTITKAIPRDSIHRYCRWHAAARAHVRNAQGVLPGMAQLYKLLKTPKRLQRRMFQR
jgi:hypothetical protein